MCSISDDPFVKLCDEAAKMMAADRLVKPHESSGEIVNAVHKQRLDYANTKRETSRIYKIGLLRHKMKRPNDLTYVMQYFQYLIKEEGLKYKMAATQNQLEKKMYAILVNQIGKMLDGLNPGRDRSRSPTAEWLYPHEITIPSRDELKKFEELMISLQSCEEHLPELRQFLTTPLPQGGGSPCVIL